MAKLRQVGNSLVVTIPAALAKQYGLRAGDDVEIEADGDVLRVVPMLRVRRHRADGEADHESEARELLRRYHAELSEALERSEARHDGAPVPHTNRRGAAAPLETRGPAAGLASERPAWGAD